MNKLTDKTKKEHLILGSQVVFTENELYLTIDRPAKELRRNIQLKRKMTHGQSKSERERRPQRWFLTSCLLSSDIVNGSLTF